MHDRRELDKWLKQYPALSKRSVRCPSCDAVIPVLPIQVDGKVLDTKYSDPDKLLYGLARYPAFVPEVLYKHDTGFALIQCNGCATDMLALIPEEDYKKPKVVWPLPGLSISDDVPEPVRSAVLDGKRAYAADSTTGAVMSIRTAIERIQRREKVKSLSDLWETRSLPKSLFDSANEPRLWGHVVAHDDFDPAAVTGQHVHDLLDFVDLLLDTLYVTPARLERAKKSRGEIAGSP